MWTVPRYGTVRWYALIKWRKAELKKKLPDGKLSPHFRYQEFATRDGTPIPVKAIPALKRHCQVYLEPMREKFGPCHILSAYRHQHYNRSIGGASNSFHIYDDHPGAPATDLSFVSGTPADWYAEAKRIRDKIDGGKGGIGYYPRMGFVHVDRRPYRADWSGK